MAQERNLVRRMIGSHVQIAEDALDGAHKIGLHSRTVTPILLNAAENLAMAGLLSEGMERGFFWHAVSTPDPLKRLLQLMPEDCAMKAPLESLLDLSAMFSTSRWADLGKGIGNTPSAEYVTECSETLRGLITRCHSHFKLKRDHSSLVSEHVEPMREDFAPRPQE
jgi:hypothetical protein